MIKKRLFIANDSSFLDTGYGVYGKELLTRLHNSGKYDVAELGCYAVKNQPQIKNIPWKFYPNAVSADDPRFEQYKSSVANQFGAWRFVKAILDFKPDIVFDVRDYWMYSYQESTSLKKYFSWVIMPTTDSAPQKLEWLYTFANADLVVPYTEWAKKVLSESCGNLINLHPRVANAGINPHEFYPMPDKKQHKTRYFDKNYNVIGLVMRNQKRKLMPDVMLAFRKYLNKLKESKLDHEYDNTILYLHTSYPEESGWDLPALLLEYGVADKTYFTYVCKNCNTFAPKKFQGPLTNCDKCKNKSALFSSPSNGVPTSQLNEIYNLFDLFVQCAICEGFGMPQIEAASCGVQIASVDYSAMTEIVEKLDGIKIPVIRLFREMETNANRANPDIDAMSNIFYDYFIKTSIDQKQQQSINIRKKCIDIYSWDNVYKVWDECFDNIDISKKLPWDLPIKSITNHQAVVPRDLNPKDFVDYICGSIINEPELVNTAHIQMLIKDFAAGLGVSGGGIRQLSYEQIAKILETFLSNKIAEEDTRNQPSLLQQEDFLS